MKKWHRVTIGVTLSLFVVLLAGGIIVRQMLYHSVPGYSGTVSVKGINAPVTIYTDSLGVPAVLAATEQDAAFALGYLHARERMFQMDLGRRAGSGTLSEVFGAKTIAYDKLFRTVGIRSVASQILARLDSFSVTMLQAYSDGVNAWLASGNRLPVEFDVLGYTPARWQPLDCVTIVRMMAWELNIAWWEDIAFTHVLQKLGNEKGREIIPDYPENGALIIPQGLPPLTPDALALVETDRAFRKFMGSTGTHIGSNNWVVSGSRSVSGKPVIANDPHLGYTAPGRWFAAVLRGGAWDLAGVTLPGVPAVVIGRNRDLSWVLTNVMADDADFYAEQIDSSGGNYFVDGAWKKLQMRTEVIKVKDEADVPLQVKQTHRGPLVTGVHPSATLFNGAGSGSYAYSMQWVGSVPTGEVECFMRLPYAKNWQEFRAAVSLFAVPGQNFVYADKAGNIGYICGSKLPVRGRADKLFVADGRYSANDWQGFVPSAEMPVLFNPENGYIATANNKTDKAFPYYISNLWEPHSRINRINQLLSAKQKHGVADFQAYQNDITSPYALEMKGAILRAFEGVAVTDNVLEQSLALLKKWGGDMDATSQVPAMYAAFLGRYLRNTFLDDLGEPLYREFCFVGNVPYRVLTRITAQKNAAIFDMQGTPQIENRDMIIRKSFADALTELEARLGKDLRFWQWGDLHKATFRHFFSGTSAILDPLVNIGPFPVGGDGTTLFNTEYHFVPDSSMRGLPHEGNYYNNLGPSMRYIYDFAEPDVFWLVLTSGQSGNIFSPHYRDMAELWRLGRYIKIRTDEASIRKNTDELQLLPEK